MPIAACAVHTMTRRLAAVAALVLALANVCLMTLVAFIDFPRGALGLTLLAVALAASWYGLVRRGLVRLVGVGAASVSVVVLLWLLISAEPVLVLLSIAALLLVLAAGADAIQIGRANG